MIARQTLQSFIAFAAFLLVGSGVRGLVPWPSDSRMRPKLDAFFEHKDEFDAVYFGSSRVYRGLMPSVIDPMLSTDGRTWRSYNLGIPGGWTYEADHLMEEVLAARPANLRWVFVEPMSYGAWLPEKNRFSQRTVHWHCWSHTWRAVRWSWITWLQGTRRALAKVEDARGAIELTRSSIERGTRLRDHVLLFLWRLGNYGMGPRIAMSVTGLDGADDDPQRKKFENQSGFEALDEPDPRDPAARAGRRQRFVRSTAEYENYVSLLDGQFDEASDVEISETDLSMIEWQKRRVAEAGAEIVFVFPPGIFRSPQIEALVTRGHLPTVMWYQDPKAYPEFYEIGIRFDASHFNTRGSRMFSREFARDVADILTRE